MECALSKKERDSIYRYLSNIKGYIKERYKGYYSISGNYNIEILKTLDDWFYVDLSSKGFFKCDTFEGVKQLLDFLILKIIDREDVLNCVRNKKVFYKSGHLDEFGIKGILSIGDLYFNFELSKISFTLKVDNNEIDMGGAFCITHIYNKIKSLKKPNV